MAATHGANWSGQLTAPRVELQPLIHKLRQRGGPKGQHSGDFEDDKGKTNGAGAKRGRDSFRAVEKRDRDSFKVFKQKREGDGLAMIPKNERTPSSFSPHLSPAADLLRDTNAGQNVLHKLCNCSWWEWTKGSTWGFWQWPA
jgi:hypothetical protein